ncbi:MAG TPA: hypothetical protein PLI09_12625 [Candidatus Hydrogenedentes bacterium]|nr:hypothetical protein [Candidatus Hydrogenedentota bacterium]
MMKMWVLFLCMTSLAGAEGANSIVVSNGTGMEAVFEHTAQGWQWVAFRDTKARREWPIAGARFSVQIQEGTRTNLGDTGFAKIKQKKLDGRPCVVMETELPQPPVAVRQIFSFCGDDRTLRIQTSLKALGDPLTIQRTGLLELKVAGELFRTTSQELVSSPIFSDRLFAGVEHPSAWCQADQDTFHLAQHAYTKVTKKWVNLPSVVLGAASEADVAAAGSDALRRSFIRYLDTVRVKPKDMHVHYNDWWTAPVPSSEQFVLSNIAELKKGLYDPTGFFFDSYALDAGWSNPKSAWEMNNKQFPEGFKPLRKALEGIGSHVGLWISPSSLYPFALDNKWLNSAGYEVMPHPTLGFTACLAKGGKYQTAFKKAVLKHAKDGHLAHMKFDGFVPQCDVAAHGHPVGQESWLPIAEGLMEVFDALREKHPDIAMEPTCFWYNPSPWWLMHVPFIIGPFGDDCPRGRCPCPEWIESLTTARDIENLKGRNAFLMPSAALQCFDIIVQCPGAFQNHAVMAIGRGRWFISTYINPRFMDAAEWRFFAELMRWARANREFLQEPLPIGGDPEKRQAYGYAYQSPEREVYCLRNPWIEETSIALPAIPGSIPLSTAREVRMLYPRKALLQNLEPGEIGKAIALGPFETAMIEVLPRTGQAAPVTPQPDRPVVTWKIERSAAEQVDSTEEQSAFWEGVINVESSSPVEMCLLNEGHPGVSASQAILQIDGNETPLSISRTEGAFSATGAPQKEFWSWFTAALPNGKHHFMIKAGHAPKDSTFSVFVRGETKVSKQENLFNEDYPFPVYSADRIPWSYTIFSGSGTK